MDINTNNKDIKKKKDVVETYNGETIPTMIPSPLSPTCSLYSGYNCGGTSGVSCGYRCIFYDFKTGKSLKKRKINK